MPDFKGQVKIPGDMAAEARTFLNEVQATLGSGQGGDMALDASDVTQAGSACVQVIIYAAKMCRDRGVQCTVEHAPAAMRTALSDFGVLDLFADVREV